MSQTTVPDPRPRLRRASARGLLGWHRLAGPFWPYVGAPPFISPFVPDSPAPVRRAMAPRIGRLLGAAGPGLVAVIIDLPAVPMLEMASALAAAGCWVVPLIQRWLADGAVLPAEPLARALYAPPKTPVPPPAPIGVVFILDGQRAGKPARLDRRYRPRRFDNRYEYTPHVLPPPGFLAQHGVGRVSLLARNGRVAPDLALYVRDLATAGLIPGGAPGSAP